ncbi:MAG: V-type ATP synthase subunit B [Gammaproteobacteria bacterium]|nr:V-type ATP synthase subunit B [Gammaproteobacteria bacterium]
MFARLTAEGAANRVEGPLLFLRRTLDVGYNEAVEVEGSDGIVRLGRVATVDDDTIVIEVLDDTAGLALAGTRVRFFGEPLKFNVGYGILDRVFNGVGEVIDGGPPIAAEKSMSIDGLPMKPVAREAPKDFLETGVSAIDLMNSLVRGQKLPLFSGGGLPHDQIAMSIAANARLPSAEAQEFAIVFAGIGVPHESAEYFQREMERSGALERSVLFLNLASDSSAQRLLTPRYALTAAEYLAFHEGKHVLVILTDMTNYCEALREVSASRGEVPSRKGYPGYMYSDLATLFERAGRIKGMPGTLTQLPILTMPNDDIGHPIPDLSGYITEGQIVLDRDLHRRGIYPPVKVLPSLSRLMKDGIGEGMTHRDHPALAAQLYAAYARAQQARILASVVGEDGLTEVDRQFLEFGSHFESNIIAHAEPRPVEDSMAVGWEGLKHLPRNELHRLSDAQIEQHLGHHDQPAEE